MRLFSRPIARTLYSVTKPRMMRCLAELGRLQWLSLDELTALQHQHLKQILEYAHTFVPYYQDLFRAVGFHPSDLDTAPDSFRDLPLLTKDAIRQNFERLITTEPARQNSLFKAKTGGTTGEPMWFMQDRVYDDYRVAHNFHQMQWSGWRLGQSEGRLWGHVIGGETGQKPLATRLRERLVNRFHSNAFHMTPESMEQFASQLERHPGTLVWSYVSTMYRFAEFVRERGRPIPLHAVYTAAEPLYPHQRELIEQVFQCRVFNSYSSLETGDIACECDRHDGLHVMMRNCYLEVLRDGRPAADGEEGEFIVTNLTNLAFPLIRYKIEDGGIRRAQPCSCGRGLPMLEVVEGRIIDFFRTRDRGNVWGAFVLPMVPALGKIKQYQIVQKNLDSILLRLVTHAPIDTAQLARIERACKMNLGEQVQVQVAYVDSLPATPTGKHRYVISEIPATR